MRGDFASNLYPYLTGYLAAWAEANFSELKRATTKPISSVPPLALYVLNGSAQLLAAPQVRLALPASAVRLLPAPPECKALPAAQPRPLLMAPPRAPMLPLHAPQRSLPLIGSNSGNRRHCFAAQHRHIPLHPITGILDLMDPGERRLYEILLERCGTSLLASMTMQRDEPITITIGRKDLISLWLESKCGQDWKQDAVSKVDSGDPKKIKKAIKILVESARKGVKDAANGLRAKLFIDVIHPTDDVYRKEIAYLVYISQQALKRLSDAEVVLWRAKGPGRILMNSKGDDLPGQTGTKAKRPKN